MISIYGKTHLQPLKLRVENIRAKVTAKIYENNKGPSALGKSK